MSAELLVLLPSRGRPELAARFVDAAAKMSDGRVDFLLGLDRDDPTLDGYVRNPALRLDQGVRTWVIDRRLSLSDKVNTMADRALDAAEPPRFLAFMADDCLPRTRDWDLHLTRAAGSMHGWAYADDQFQRSRLPTHWVVCANVVRQLGWMMLPEVEHMFVDNAVLALGSQLGRIAYCPDVTIEHLHPVAGKAALDDTYGDMAAQLAADRTRFEAWRAGPDFQRCLDRLVEVLP